MQTFTIGHSTRNEHDFIELLKHHAIQLVVDVRHFPASRHNPQFNKDNLEKILPENGIDYKWMEELGGFRACGYKAFTKTEEFRKGISALVLLTKKKRTAVMCAELRWYKCHRRYIADELKRRKFIVKHIFDKTRTDTHKITIQRSIMCDKKGKNYYNIFIQVSGVLQIFLIAKIFFSTFQNFSASLALRQVCGVRR